MPQTGNVLLGGVTFNEIGYDPSGTPGFDTDGALGISGNHDEFIEFVNLSGSPVNMTGVTLWDATSGGVSYTFGAVTLGPGERFVLIGENADLASFQAANPGIQSDNADNTMFNLNNLSEQLALVDAAGNYITFSYTEPGGSAPPSVTTIVGFTGTNLLSSETFNMPTAADGQSIQRFPDGDTTFVVGNASSGGANLCFAAGSLIADVNGETAVEALTIGTRVMTADGTAVSVKWIGHQTVRKHRDGASMQPVRICAGALGDGLPTSDLTVTADHGMILDNLIINAAALINGTTINFVPLADLPDRVTYYHIETEAHDVILANGAPAETFVDAVTRASFDNYAEYLDLYGAERIIPEMNRLRISSQRLLPEAIKARLGIAEALPSFENLKTAG